MSGRFSVGGAPKSEFAGFAPISDGVVEETCLREMMRQDLGLHGDYFWEVLPSNAFPIRVWSSCRWLRNSML